MSVSYSCDKRSNSQRVQHTDSIYSNLKEVNNWSRFITPGKLIITISRQKSAWSQRYYNSSSFRQVCVVLLIHVICPHLIEVDRLIMLFLFCITQGWRSTMSRVIINFFQKMSTHLLKGPILHLHRRFRGELKNERKMLWHRDIWFC